MDIEKSYTKKYLIAKEAISTNRTASSADLLNILQEIATIHSDELGFSTDYFFEQNLGWAIVGWFCEFYSYPKWRDEISVTTYCSQFNKSIAIRSFVIKNEKNEIIAKAISHWALMDTIKRRPIKPNPAMLEAYSSNEEPIFQEKRPLEIKCENAKLINETSLTVRRYETDYNGHTNNNQYIKWALEQLSDEIYEKNSISKVTVLYKKECKKGDELILKTYKLEENKIVCKMYDNDDLLRAQVYFEIKS